MRTQPDLQRRQVLRAGVWAAPVVMIAAAAPASAASLLPTDLEAVSIVGPTEAQDGEIADAPAYLAGRTYTFRGTLRNNGPEAAAPGSTVSFELNSPAPADTPTFPTAELVSVSGGFSTTELASDPTYLSLSIDQEIPAGATIEIVYSSYAAIVENPDQPFRYVNANLSVHTVASQEESVDSNQLASGATFYISQDPV